MPLPPPACAREPGHQRTITVRSYRRTDGLWDIEGHLTDVWPHDLKTVTGTLLAHQPMHEMWLRLTIDASATIVAAQAVGDAGPYGPACGAIAPDYSQLVGVKVARGYRDAVRRLFARTAGCTHMTELANIMGSAALQAMWDDLRGPEDHKPFSIDGCHALASSGPQVATYFPRWYRPVAEGG